MTSRLPWIIVLLAVATGLGMWLGQRVAGPASPPQYQALLAYGQPRALSAFNLAASDGSQLTPDRLRGRYSLLFFGFTHCPDVCPTALSTIRQIENVLASSPETNKVNYVFISVDPERDNSTTLHNYAKYFSPHIIAATGSHEDLRSFTREMGVVYSRTEANGEYSIDHSAHFVVLNRNVEIVGIIRPPQVPNAIAADLRQLMEFE